VPVLVVAAVVLGTLYLARRPQRGQGSDGPAAAERVGNLVRWLWRGLLALLAVGVLAAMARGCDGGEDDRQPPCVAYRPGDCATDGGSTTTTSSDGLDLGGEPRYEPCPAYREEDCPLAPASGP
jgi:hypothetical protein